MAHMKGHRAVTTIYLDPAVLTALQKLSTDTGVAMAEYLREAVDDLLRKHRVRVPARRPRA